MKILNSFLLNMSKALIIQDVHWAMIRSQVQHIIPALSYDSHKGQMGRIGVIGGSADYTGAPFYASKAALLFGADLVFIFCAPGALLPIKSYSPEFMVSALYEEHQLEEGEGEGEEGARKKRKLEEGGQLATAMVEKMRASLWRLHVLVMGPGLGRSVSVSLSVVILQWSNLLKSTHLRVHVHVHVWMHECTH
jgi:ATP-dependent NAD(P)H-hydrate dehydratase